MRNRAVRAVMLVVAAIHVVPALAAVSSERVQRTYGIAEPDPGVELLLRHRAVLFAVVAGGLVRGAFVDRHRTPAVAVASVAMGSYVVLARSIGPANDRLAAVEKVDRWALGALVAAWGLDRLPLGR